MMWRSSPVFVAGATLLRRAALGGLTLFGVAVASWTVSTVAAQSPPGTLLQPSNLVYLGAFELPKDEVNGSTFEWGGTALAYNAAHNSLFIVGHDWYQKTAEISIPRIVNSTNLDDLAVAQFLQGFTDASEGRMLTIDGPDSKINVGGLLVFNGLLYGTAYSYYDASGTVTRSHFRRPLNLSTTGQVRGMFRPASTPAIQGGPLTAGFAGGWLGEIPPEWQTALGGRAFTGLCCVSIISRTSWGPALFAFDPAQLGTINPDTGTLPLKPLLYYTSDYPMPGRALYETIKAAIFPRGSRTVLFPGWKGVGPYWYGSVQPDGSCPEQYKSLGKCVDPVFPDQGDHQYPYVAQWWAFDVQDLAAVAAGTKQPWQVTPYGEWPLSMPVGSGSFKINGAAYDPASQRIFVSQLHGEPGTAWSLIHVYQIIGLGGSGPPPAPPRNLRIVPD